MTRQFISRHTCSSCIIIALMALMALCASCNPDVKAVSGMKVVIDINPYIISSGFIKVSFVPNEDAYYHVGIVPVDEAPDTTSNASVKGFMSLMLDRTYADYLYWRAWLLSQGVSPVAEFPTHSLQYGTVEHNFTFLEPDKEYMVYAFAVDAKTNKPDGRLFTSYVSTTDMSCYEDIEFEYRVRGYWDYVYPTYFFMMGDGNQIVNYVPWVGATVDSLALREYGMSPMRYFVDMFQEYVLYKEDDRIHFGIYAHNNNGIGDGTSSTLFEEGHTYYTGIALMDGYLSNKASVIYKFRWDGESTQLYFDSSDELKTMW